MIVLVRSSIWTFPPSERRSLILPSRLHLLLGVETGLVLCPKRRKGGDAKDVPLLRDAQGLRFQDDVQGLVPRYVDEPDGNPPFHVVRRYDVQVADLGDDPEDVRQVGVLEVQGDPLPDVFPAGIRLMGDEPPLRGPPGRFLLLLFREGDDNGVILPFDGITGAWSKRNGHLDSALACGRHHLSDGNFELPRIHFPQQTSVRRCPGEYECYAILSFDHLVGSVTRRRNDYVRFLREIFEVYAQDGLPLHGLHPIPGTVEARHLFLLTAANRQNEPVPLGSDEERQGNIVWGLHQHPELVSLLRELDRFYLGRPSRHFRCRLPLRDPPYVDYDSERVVELEGVVVIDFS
jgi:hypothetical protein